VRELSPELPTGRKRVGRPAKKCAKANQPVEPQLSGAGPELPSGRRKPDRPVGNGKKAHRGGVEPPVGRRNALREVRK
jgi:hypothetical protein